MTSEETLFRANADCDDGRAECTSHLSEDRWKRDMEMSCLPTGGLV